MLVVADTSPLSILIRIGRIDALPRLFNAVCIPPEVRDELAHPKSPQAVRDFAASPPAWMNVRAPADIESIVPLGLGERAAISLAREIHADALLIDERDGRNAATQRGIKIIGTLGLLEEAAKQSLLSLPEAVDELRRTNFRLDARLIQEALQRDASRRGPPPAHPPA